MQVIKSTKKINEWELSIKGFLLIVEVFGGLRVGGVDKKKNNWLRRGDRGPRLSFVCCVWTCWGVSLRGGYHNCIIHFISLSFTENSSSSSIL